MYDSYHGNKKNSGSAGIGGIMAGLGGILSNKNNG